MQARQIRRADNEIATLDTSGSSDTRGSRNIKAGVLRLKKATHVTIEPWNSGMTKRRKQYNETRIRLPR